MAQTPVRTDARYAGTKVHAEECNICWDTSAELFEVQVTTRSRQRLMILTCKRCRPDDAVKLTPASLVEHARLTDLEMQAQVSELASRASTDRRAVARRAYRPAELEQEKQKKKVAKDLEAFRIEWNSDTLIPRKLQDLEALDADGILRSGQTFTMFAALQLAESEENERHGKNYLMKIKKPLRYHSCCGLEDSCQYDLKATFKVGADSAASWTVESFHPHSCDVSLHKQARKRTSAYSCEQLARAVLPYMSEDQVITKDTVRNAIFNPAVGNLIRLSPPDKLLDRVRTAAVDMARSTAKRGILQLEALAAEARKLGHQVQVISINDFLKNQGLFSCTHWGGGSTCLNVLCFDILHARG